MRTHWRKRRPLRLVAAFTALGLVVAACADDDGDADPADPGEATDDDAPDLSGASVSIFGAPCLLVTWLSTIVFGEWSGRTGSLSIMCPEVSLVDAPSDGQPAVYLPTYGHGDWTTLDATDEANRSTGSRSPARRRSEDLLLTPSVSFSRHCHPARAKLPPIVIPHERSECRDLLGNTHN
jgi:hypothetical protein